DPEALLSKMSEQRVTCLLSVVPSLLHALTEAAARRAHALPENAPEVRGEGSQGQVRSAAQHAAPGNQETDEQPGTGDRDAAATASVGPPGLEQSSSIQGQRAYALAPGYLPSAPPARHLRLILTSGENLLLSECAKARATFGEALTIVNQ